MSTYNLVAYGLHHQNMLLQHSVFPSIGTVMRSLTAMRKPTKTKQMRKGFQSTTNRGGSKERSAGAREHRKQQSSAV